MITIKTLMELNKILSYRKLLVNSDLSYLAIIRKVREGLDLTTKESQIIEQLLAKYNLQIINKD